MVTELDQALGEEEEEEEDEAASTGSSTSGSSTNGASTTGKKKKKKKKKKNIDALKAGGQEAATGASASTSKPKSDKEAEKRLNAAIEVARKGEDLWVDLSSSPLTLAKTKKLLEALRPNDCVTSLNLSSSTIDDEGVQAIAGVLGVNGASALIDLDLRDNPLTEAGLTALEGLQKVRKKLMVRTGSLVVEADQAAGAKGSAVVTAAAGRDGSALREGLSKGKMFKKFFQSNEDDDEASMTRQESHLDDRGVNPEELWGSVKDMLKATPMDIPELSLKLQQLHVLLDREVRAIQNQHSNALDGSKPHMRECVTNFDALKAILAAVPRKVIVQYDKEAQDAVGSHRVGAAEVVALLLGPNNSYLDRAVAAAKLVPLVMHLSLLHPLCSTLHARGMRILRSCLTSTVPDLCMPMLTQAGWGCGLKEPPRLLQGLGAAAANSSSGSGKTACRSLPDLLAAASTPAVGVPSGLRSRASGFLLEMCRALLEVAEAPLAAGGKRHEAAKALQMSGPWSKFVAGADAFDSEDGTEGALRLLLAEQDADLCGPKPMRPPVEEAADMANMGGGLMSGREILALLQGMSLGGGMSQLGAGV